MSAILPLVQKALVTVGKGQMPAWGLRRILPACFSNVPRGRVFSSCPIVGEALRCRTWSPLLRLVLLRHKFLRKFGGKLRAHAGHRGSRAWPIA